MYVGCFAVSFYRITGNHRLSGSVTVQGAKNSVLPILASCLLVRGQCVLHRCPLLSDVQAALKILVRLGCVCVWDDETVIVDAREVACCEIPQELMSKMRSSVMFLGAILARMGKAVISAPGGCELGPRPIDLHISALEKLGTNFECRDEILTATAPKGLIGNRIFLRFSSVGATDNVLIAAVTAKGTTVIENAAREPEISDLADFLNACGAKVSGAGSSTITVVGVARLYPTEFRVMPDRIAATTWLACAAVTNGDVCLKETVPAHMVQTLRLFEKAGCRVAVSPGEIRLIATERPRPVTSVVTRVYPGFPTDAAPVCVPLLCLADGVSRVRETIFENRFRYIEQLGRFGANYRIESRELTVFGVEHFTGCECECTDLRGGAALLVAALAAEGESRVEKIDHVKRGYFHPVEILQSIGANITEVENGTDETQKTPPASQAS